MPTPLTLLASLAEQAAVQCLSSQCRATWPKWSVGTGALQLSCNGSKYKIQIAASTYWDLAFSCGKWDFADSWLYFQWHGSICRTILSEGCSLVGVETSSSVDTAGLCEHSRLPANNSEVEFEGDSLLWLLVPLFVKLRIWIVIWLKFLHLSH